MTLFEANQTVLSTTPDPSSYITSIFYTTTQIIFASSDDEFLPLITVQTTEDNNNNYGDNKNADFDVVDVFGILAVTFGWFICVPIIIYYLYKLHQISDETIMQNRHLSSIYTLNGLILCTLIFLQLFDALFTIWNVSMYKIQSIIPFWVLYLINAIFILPIFHQFALKTYLLYFEQKYQLAIINITWLKQLNNGVTDWYITKRHTFGNFNYLLKLSIIPYTIQLSMYIVVHVWFDGKPLLFHILTLLFSSLPLIIALVLFCRVKGFDDLYGIKNEIKYQCIIIFVMLIIYLILFVTFEFLPSTSKLIRIEWITYLIFIDFLFFGLSILSTAYPVYLNLYGITTTNDPNAIKMLSLRRQSSSLKMIYHRGHTKDISSISSKNGLKSKSSGKTKHLLECISDEKWFISFMQHLV